MDTITSCENKLLELWKHEILNFSLVKQTRRMWAIWDKSSHPNPNIQILYNFLFIFPVALDYKENFLTSATFLKIVVISFILTTLHLIQGWHCKEESEAKRLGVRELKNRKLFRLHVCMEITFYVFCEKHLTTKQPMTLIDIRLLRKELLVS